MRTGHKQYFIEAYETRTLPNGITYGRNVDVGNASTLKNAKSMITQYRRNYAQYNPMDFRVYDCYAEVDEKTGFVPCVYQEN